MKLTKEMRARQNSIFVGNRTEAKAKYIRYMVSFTSGPGIWLKKTETLLDMVVQVDAIMNGDEYEVQWYTLDGDYLQIQIKYADMFLNFSCREIFETLENFLQVECKLEETRVTKPATTVTVKNLLCLNGGE